MEITNPKEIRIDAYNYDLPDHRIAKYPLVKRDDSKLLVYEQDKIIDSSFVHLPEYIPANSLMIFNNTKVIQARMHFVKPTGAQIEIFCLEPFTPNDYLLNFQQRAQCSWVCFVGNLKKWKEGELTKVISIEGNDLVIKAERIRAEGDAQIITFSWNNTDITFADILGAAGELPIPPYLNRHTEDSDKQTYQTLYSKIDGSVAAPTAGLHFSEEVFAKLKARGIQTDEVTLHVGAGTFRPVKSEQLKDHEMHSEFISVRKELIQKLVHHQGPLIAVGTTSVRTIESLYSIGQLVENASCSQLKVSQWMPYASTENSISPQKALTNILEYLINNNLDTLVADTQIMIAPGYQFKFVEGIVTNFHQPQSTLLLLISAFLGDNIWENIYLHALNNDYRFLSYGDSSLLLK